MATRTAKKIQAAAAPVAELTPAEVLTQAERFYARRVEGVVARLFWNYENAVAMARKEIDQMTQRLDLGFRGDSVRTLIQAYAEREANAHAIRYIWCRVASGTPVAEAVEELIALLTDEVLSNATYGGSRSTSMVSNAEEAALIGVKAAIIRDSYLASARETLVEARKAVA